MCAKSSQSIPTLCDPMDCSLPGSSVHGIFQARILEWVGVSFSRGLPNPWIEPKSPMSPALAGRFLTTGPTWSFSLIIPSYPPTPAQGQPGSTTCSLGAGGDTTFFITDSVSLCHRCVSCCFWLLKSSGWRY